MRAFLQVWIAVQRLNGHAHRSLPLGACVRLQHTWRWPTYPHTHAGARTGSRCGQLTFDSATRGDSSVLRGVVLASSACLQALLLGPEMSCSDSARGLTMTCVLVDDPTVDEDDGLGVMP